MKSQCRRHHDRVRGRAAPRRPSQVSRLRQFGRGLWSSHRLPGRSDRASTRHCCRPRSTASPRMANEWTAKIYWQDYKVRSVGVRPVFVYGPGPRRQGMSSTPTKAMLAAAVGRPYHISVRRHRLLSARGRRRQGADPVGPARRSMARLASTSAAPGSSMTDVIDAITAAAPDSDGQDHRRVKPARPSRTSTTAPRSIRRSARSAGARSSMAPAKPSTTSRTPIAAGRHRRRPGDRLERGAFEA